MPLFEVVYDGASRPIIQTPTGRMLSLSEFNNGRWTSYEREDADCKVIVQVLNFTLTNAPEMIAHWKETEDATA